MKSSKGNKIENVQPTEDSKDKELCNFLDPSALINQAERGGSRAEKSFNFDEKLQYQLQMRDSSFMSDVGE